MESHKFSKPRPIPNTSPPTWEVEVLRLSNDKSVGALQVNNDNLGPRRNKKGKVVWKLPESAEIIPKFGENENKRLWELFKLQKKERRKSKKQNVDEGGSNGGAVEGEGKILSHAQTSDSDLTGDMITSEEKKNGEQDTRYPSRSLPRHSDDTPLPVNAPPPGFGGGQPPPPTLVKEPNKQQQPSYRRESRIKPVDLTTNEPAFRRGVRVKPEQQQLKPEEDIIAKKKREPEQVNSRAAALQSAQAPPLRSHQFQTGSAPAANSTSKAATEPAVRQQQPPPGISAPPPSPGIAHPEVQQNARFFVICEGLDSHPASSLGNQIATTFVRCLSTKAAGIAGGQQHQWLHYYSATAQSCLVMGSAQAAPATPNDRARQWESLCLPGSAWECQGWTVQAVTGQGNPLSPKPSTSYLVALTGRTRQKQEFLAYSLTLLLSQIDRSVSFSGDGAASTGVAADPAAQYYQIDNDILTLFPLQHQHPAAAVQSAT